MCVGRREGLCCPLGRPCPKPLPTTDLCRRTRDQWEIPRSELEIVREIGRGQFGNVYLAKWRSSRNRALAANITVAAAAASQQVRVMLSNSALRIEIAH